MIRPYKFKHDKLHEVQSFVNYTVLEVLCKPHRANVFSENLYPQKYKALININADYILTPLTKAYEICVSIYNSGGKKNLNILKSAVLLNNRIRELCDGTVEPVLYSKIKKVDSDLCELLKTFCDKLYDNAIGLAPFYNTYGLIDVYYKGFVGKSSMCRFCGINRVLTKFHAHRSAFDHYLPRQHYPFTSVNFKNLVPLCDTCNSKYKLGENTLYKTENKGRKAEKTYRMKAFYPFRQDTPDIKIEITLNKAYSTDLEPTDMGISLTCLGCDEEIDTWDRLFGIKENYLAACCTEEMYSYYEEQYMADINYGKTHNEYLTMLTNNRFGDINFLKIPFLEAVAN